MRPNLQNEKTYADLLANTENTWDYSDDKGFYIDTKHVDGEKVKYEIIFGNEKIVFIKAGAGGSARGYENKYLKMARRVHDRIGATVICASNPDVPHEELDELEICWVVSERGFERFELYLWGTSDGAYQNLSLAIKFPETVKWIGVNASFIMLTGFEEKLQELSSVKKLLVYGTQDDEYDVVFSVLKAKEDENRKILFAEGADHCFSDMLPQFIQTIDLIYEEDVYDASAEDPELEHEGIEELMEGKK